MTTPTTPNKAPSRPKKVVHTVRKVQSNGDLTTPGQAVVSFPEKYLAENYIKQNHPRGREVYLDSPDNPTPVHYSADLAASNHPSGGWSEYSEDEDAY